MILEATVQPPSDISFSDGDDVKLRAGKTAELITASQHADYYTITSRGQLYHGYSTTAAALPITSTTAPTFILWNPYGSGIKCVLVKYLIGYVSGKNVEGNTMLGVISNTAGALSTGGPISAFTRGPVINGLLDGAAQPHALFGVAATIIAATVFLTTGISLMQLTATNSSPVHAAHPFEGTVIVPPGVAIFTCASAASVALYNERLIWYEYPL
jgi:hypothetical protein